jgi:tricorn protease
VDTTDTRLLYQPAIGRDHVAFIYANDLWVCGLDGQNVRRLTTDPGVESYPRFSPDGKYIAFSGQYDGNLDVFLVPVEGGMPKRLTWHPGPDWVRGFTPDGSAVLFTSVRSTYEPSPFAYAKLFTVPLTGGFPEALKIPHAYKASYSSDGTMMAYTPLPEPFNQWKHYRGGTHSRIWLFKFRDNSVEQIPQPEGRCNDTDPMVIGDRIYFRSDRHGEFNLFSYDPQTKNATQLTQFEDFPVLNATAGHGKIVFDRAGYIHVFDPATGGSEKMTIGVAADLQEVRPRYIRGFNYIRSASISPSGARAVFEFRGEIITVPAEKGDPRNITNTQGVHERSPAWSPDGKWIAYFSDATGEYRLHLKSQDGKGEAKAIELMGSGFYNNPIWSPDSKKISYFDYARSLFWLDIESGEITKIASEPQMGIWGVYSTWSPDSKWIAYTLHTQANIQRVYLYSLDQDKTYPVTDGMSEVQEPVFDKSGKYLYFLASTDAGPVKNWFAMSVADMEMRSSIYMAVLAKGIPSPLARESDEEEVKEEKPEEEAKEKPEKKAPSKAEEKKVEDLKIDIEGLDFRIIALPVPPGAYSNLQAGDEGQIYYLEAPSLGMASAMIAGQQGNKLKKFDLKTKKSDELAQGIMAYELSADNKKILYLGRNMAGIAPSGAIKPGQGKLNTAALEVYINPRVEWKQIYHEAWRINRDQFYDPNMHGADWDAMYKKYEQFLPHISCRSDLTRVLRWLGSELAVGHHGTGGGDSLVRPKRVPGGLLGADYAIEEGRYRFKKIYGGLNWNPQLRSPLTEPGVDVEIGDYLLKVNGTELRPPTNLFSLFENTAGKITEITVGPNADGTDSRTVSVVPVPSEQGLRARAWIEGNLKKVNEATGGRVAYVYVPNTTLQGHIAFKRYFFPQADKDAIIVDERFNGGGQVADYYIDLLRRPYIAHWHTRYGADIKTPNASIQGPKVMLINETAGSGGDLLPYMFRKFKLGKLIGKRTWGGLVGNLGVPILMDGGVFTAPNLGFWTEEEGWAIENVGIPPDIEVEQWPAEVISGHDPQLETAIRVIMEELEKNPPKRPKRPAYPVRVKK